MPESDTDSDGSSSPNPSPRTPVVTSTPAAGPAHQDTTPENSSGSSSSLSRKRKRNISDWKKNKKSRAYNGGLRYQNGRQYQRSVGARCNCKRGECSKITDEARQAIFNAFWNADSDKKSRQSFIIAHTERKAKKRAILAPQRNRGASVVYFLTVGDKKHTVCQDFFLNTLSISSKMVLYNLKKTVNGVRVQPEKRPAHNQTPDDVKMSVINHIKMFPKIESHYCRRDIKREYLESHLTIRQMYRLYKKASPANTAKEHFYRKVFNTEFNLGFHVPSKDQCDDCDIFKKKLAPSDKEKAEYEAHNRRKDQARDAKEVDKSLKDGTLAVTFDLQQVLTVPRLFAGSSYYKRKLNTYNLTFYELQTGTGHCYTWTESEANRGSNDIASLIIKFLTMIDETGGVHRVILYSDTCGGQNRNKVVITAILSFLATSRNIKRVTQKFFEKGHSHMECDSMHSCIEGEGSKGEVELPSDYITIMKAARKSGSPYRVTEICHSDIKDYSQLNSTTMPAQAFKGIINVHLIDYTKSDEQGDPVVKMADEIEGELRSIAFRKRGGQQRLDIVVPCYARAPGIRPDKKKDLISMITNMSNKSLATLYYNSLPTCDEEQE